MKNIVKCMVLIVVLFIMSGCGIKTVLQNSQKTQAPQYTPIPTSSTKGNLNNNKSDNISNTTANTDAKTINNLFFFKSNVSQLNYKGIFSFSEESVKKDVKLHINEVANIKNGKLYEIKLDSINDIPSERLNLGYFYVQMDKIYRLEATEENFNELKTMEEVSNDIVIVCQDKEIKDTLNKDELGWHHYIEETGDRREYHSYNNKVETGYYESFIWEKNKGLINYRSGYGAEKDSIELQLGDD